MMLRTQPFTRDDTFLGVCQSLGDDFGFNPNWLRAALAPVLIWNPVLVFGAYVGLGLLIFLLHLIVSDPAVAAPAVEPAAPAQDAPRQDAEGQGVARTEEAEPELLQAA